MSARLSDALIERIRRAALAAPPLTEEQAEALTDIATETPEAGPASEGDAA